MMNGPRRPNAIATMITTDDFLQGVQTLLYSLKKTLPSEPYDVEYYPPEIIVMVTPNMSTSVGEYLHPAFCTRIIEVDPIAIPNVSKDDKDSTAASHVSSWDDCGYTKLNIFRQAAYSKILYIDSDCLVQKDVSHLFNIEGGESGLIAAAPDIFPPDKFNAGVMLLSPSISLFEDLLRNTTSTPTYDGGDTGFLNAYFNEWHLGPGSRRLGFKYNAQRFMHSCTYSKQPKYWDIGVGDIYIVHYSSTPKPWQTPMTKDFDEKQEFLGKEDSDKLTQIAKSKALDKLWNKWYRRSLVYKDDYEESQKLIENRQVIQKSKSKPTSSRGSEAPKRSNKKSPEKHKFSKRYKELRKTGLDPKEAMTTARREYGMDKDDKVSAGKQVAAMFGMPL